MVQGLAFITSERNKRNWCIWKVFSQNWGFVILYLQRLRLNMGSRVNKTSLLILNKVKRNSEFVLLKTAESLQIFSHQIQPLLEAQIYSTFCKGLVTLWATDHPKKRFASSKKVFFFASLKVFMIKVNLIANFKVF